MSEYKLTPTQELIMELLAARYRTGELVWTFNSSMKRSLNMLQSAGLLVVMHGVVERSLRASLTEKGRDEYVVAGFVTPLARDIYAEHKEIRHPHGPDAAASVCGTCWDGARPGYAVWPCKTVQALQECE